MKRIYFKIVYQKWYDAMDIEEAIATQDYSKTYYLDENTIGRIDYYYHDTGLFKISYRGMQPPFDDALEEHVRAYPGVLCEFWTPESASEGGLRLMRACLYTPSKVLESQDEVYLNDKGHVLKQITMDANGRCMREQRLMYDENWQWIGEELYTGDGKLIGKHNFLEDW